MESIDDYLKGNFTKEDGVLSQFFDHYDKNGDGCLTLDQFSHFMDDAFDCDNIKCGSSKDLISKIFHLLDDNGDGQLDEREWKMAWNYWLRQVLNPVTALLIIDIQNDFVCGSLSLRNCPAGQDGMLVIPTVNSILDRSGFDVVVYSKDWHPENHISFIDNVHIRPLHHTSKVSVEDATVTDTVVFDGPMPTEQMLWPRHCVQGSWGAELHPDLQIYPHSHIVNKGIHPDVDSYSAFWDNSKRSQTELVSLLAEHKVTDVYVCGLAYDVCVGSTALHSVEHGFRTVMVEDACRGVNLQGIDDMRQKLLNSGVHIAASDEVDELVAAKKRPLVLALKAASNYALARKMAKAKQK